MMKKQSRTILECAIFRHESSREKKSLSENPESDLHLVLTSSEVLTDLLRKEGPKSEIGKIFS